VAKECADLTSSSATADGVVSSQSSCASSQTSGEESVSADSIIVFAFNRCFALKVKREVNEKQ